MHYRNKHLLERFLLITAVSVFAAILCAGIFFSLVYFGYFGKLPVRADLLAISNEEASLVYSSDSVLIGKYFAQNRTNIRMDEVPGHLINALVATEDKRFFSHKGYDLKSYFRVFFKRILFADNSGGGGSTLTQQLVKNLYGRRNYGLFSLRVNKIKEIIIATRIEDVYSKQELLLLYLNSVPFGQDVYGVESAAHRYFDKPASKLTIEESAVLVALLKANSRFNPMLNPKNSLSRRDLVIGLMAKQHYLSAREADSLQKLPLGLHTEVPGAKGSSGYFVYQVKKKTEELLSAIKTKSGKLYNIEKDGLKIYTTLNMQVQELAAEAVKKQLSAMQPLLNKELRNYNFKRQWYKKQKKLSSINDNTMPVRAVELFGWEGIHIENINSADSLWHYYSMLNAAVFITNPKNGAVISWIGGNNFSMLPFDMVLSHRQIASAFKPVLYATALQEGIAPCTYLQNEEKKYSGYEDWEPRNANNTSTPNSKVALWYALANSMNLPTVDLYFKVGREKLLNTCKRLKFPAINDDAPSMALGTLDLSLYEIVRAYATFANKGLMNEPYMITKITDAQGKILYSNGSVDTVRVFTKDAAQAITAILQEAINQGTGTKLRSQYGLQADLAGKTGTAQNYSDSWFIAFTPDIVMGTWVGARTPDVHFYSGLGAGASLALPVIAHVLDGIRDDALLRHRYFTHFSIPEEVYSFLKCEPWRETGIKGFFNRLFNINNAKDEKTRPADKSNKNKEAKKSFFGRLFKRNR
jgi:penicillin-binding protein 1A